MHYLYRYVCILNVFFYICIWTIVCNKEFIIIIIGDAVKKCAFENLHHQSNVVTAYLSSF